MLYVLLYQASSKYFDFLIIVLGTVFLIIFLYVLLISIFGFFTLLVLDWAKEIPLLKNPSIFSKAILANTLLLDLVITTFSSSCLFNSSLHFFTLKKPHIFSFASCLFFSNKVLLSINCSIALIQSFLSFAHIVPTLNNLLNLR